MKLCIACFHEKFEQDWLTTSMNFIICGASSESMSSSIPSWQIFTAHAQPFRGARDLAICLKGPLDSLLVWVSSGGSGETARMRRLAWTFAARIGDKYQIRLTRPISFLSTLWFKSCKTIHYGKTRIWFLTDLIVVFTGIRHTLTFVEWEK